MKSFAKVVEHATSVAVVLPIEAPEVLAIGDELAALHPAAYMNGYNWAALLTRYLALRHPDLAAGLGQDPEAGTYVAYYSTSPANRQRAARLADLLNGLLDQPAPLYDFLRAEGDAVEWD